MICMYPEILVPGFSLMKIIVLKKQKRSNDVAIMLLVNVALGRYLLEDSTASTY